jgi:glutaredoxin
MSGALLGNLLALARPALDIHLHRNSGRSQVSMKWFYQLIVAAAAAALLSVAPSFAEAGCSKSVTMYNAWWCPYCRKVRAILARNHISYRILDATSPQIQTIMLRRFGDTAVPRTVIGDVVVEGVDENRIVELCWG